MTAAEIYYAFREEAEAVPMESEVFCRSEGKALNHY